MIPSLQIFLISEAAFGKFSIIEAQTRLQAARQKPLLVSFVHDTSGFADS
jgi:hypothetical protein